jgi:hypothetical protein
MVDTELLNTLVKLATLGASGISIFAIFWIGWLLYRKAGSGNLEEHKTLRYFMGYVPYRSHNCGCSGHC